ncbi:signal peptidase II [Nicoliella spurrieriana]|uniref:Lipoprotein signal peptidase n=1 Tax=Nicoliella spurrieriana TaxID=2925830 RepID=A0A976RRP9_9LACO|nr:signal peptidase II [Nicoliella spurrieriana]UQS86602.1 signal peptidase II [Nicoliella spurrieriana]
MPVIFIILLLVGLIGIDQGIKAWVSASMAQGQIETLIPGGLSLTNLHNHGAAWSMLQGKLNFFIIISIIAIAVMLYYLFKLRHSRGYTITIILLLAGTVGNFIDRSIHGYVVDMFQVDLNLPFLNFVFNFADACLTMGVILLLIMLWRSETPEKS